jgi:ubiquinone/menaquinone biosynthesis C-methylase UbiE
METQLEQIRDQQRETWNKFSPGWNKWDEFAMNFLKPAGDEIINFIAPKNEDYILDIASGTGEPGLTIAEMIPHGKVIISDLAEGMLDIAKANAARRGIKNIETIACDVSELSFPDNTFDGVSCRFGFMFFPDMDQSAKEMARVLKPGKKISISVWAEPSKNYWATVTLSTINENMEILASPPGSPGLFRCSSKGMIADIFQKSGLKNISEKEFTSKINFSSLDQYWEFMNDVVAPVTAAMGKADNDMKLKIRNEVFNKIKNDINISDGKFSIDYSFTIISGEK